MPQIPTEWPNFDGMPDDDTLTASRPSGQKLAPWIWWDGEVRDSTSPNVHYYANALHYGTAVFEGIRCYPSAAGAVLVRLREHLERMLVSARLYGMKVPFDIDALVRGAIEVTRRNGIRNGYLRPLAYFGAGPIDLKPKRECPVHVFIAVRELGTFLGEDALRNGIRVMISSWRRFHHTMLPTMAKASGHYANSVLAAHEAMDHGFDDAILLNQDGTVASATGHNVFFVRNGVLHTNDESSSIIPGITRDCVLAIAADHRVPVQIRAFTREDLLRADEVFLTGTAAEVTPVRELDGVGYAAGKNTLGALFQRAYLRAVTGKDEKHAEWLTRVG
ncbi:MAG TPA: branched-chain amino acid transaminase [Polyangiaceae bacterium]|nr:branched-chain amino acid transaminase [Polyangiaceae bacterium]